MATSPGTVDIKGKVTIELGGRAYDVADFSLPVNLRVDFIDPRSGAAMIYTDATELRKRTALLAEWVKAFPEELRHG